MSRHEVKSFFRRNNDPISEIEYIGGLNSDGSTWKLPVQKAVEGFFNGKWAFYIIVNGREIDFALDSSHESFVLNLTDINFIDLKFFNI